MFITKRIGTLAIIAAAAFAPAAGAITPAPVEIPGPSICELLPPLVVPIVGDDNANVLVGTPATT